MSSLIDLAKMKNPLASLSLPSPSRLQVRIRLINNAGTNKADCLKGRQTNRVDKPTIFVPKLMKRTIAKSQMMVLTCRATCSLLYGPNLLSPNQKWV